MPAARQHIVQATFQLPEARGGPTRQFHLLRALAANFDVSVVAAAGEHYPASAISDLEAFAELRLVSPRPWRRDPLHRAARFSRIALSPRPYGASRFDPLVEPVRRALTDLDRPPDLLYVEPSNIAGWRRLLPRPIRTAIGFHDVAFAVESEARALESSWPRRGLRAVEWRKLRAYERRNALAADLCVMTSDRDAAVLRDVAPGASTVAVANGVDAEFFAPSGAEPEADRVVLTGSMNHPPNERAAVRLVRDVLPELRARHSAVRVQIVGRDPTPAVRKLGTVAGVEVVGEVPDVRPFLERATVAVAPIEFGGGVRNKILEALAMEKAVVTTAKGAEGLGVRAGEHVAMAEMPAFAARIAALLDSPHQARELGRRGREFVLREHDWTALGARLCDVFTEVLRDPLRDCH